MTLARMHHTAFLLWLSEVASVLGGQLLHKTSLTYIVAMFSIVLEPTRDAKCPPLKELKLDFSSRDS